MKSGFARSRALGSRRLNGMTLPGNCACVVGSMIGIFESLKSPVRSWMLGVGVLKIEDCRSFRHSWLKKKNVFYFDLG